MVLINNVEWFDESKMSAGSGGWQKLWVLRAAQHDPASLLPGEVPARRKGVLKINSRPGPCPQVAHCPGTQRQVPAADSGAETTFPRGGHPRCRGPAARNVFRFPRTRRKGSALVYQERPSVSQRDR